MPRRIVRKKKKLEDGIIITLDEILEKNKEVKNVSIKYGDRHKYSENTVFYLKDNFTEDNIYLITQFFIHRQEKRRKEINYCLNQNCKIFKKIILLNERIYSKEELGVDDEGWEKIIQVDIGNRLSYKKFLDYINGSKLEGYFILSNTDIFFDETVLNLRKSFMSVEKSIFAISRLQYKSDGSTTQEFLIPDSQDVWIIHSNHLVCDTKKYDYNLGVPGCDNKIAMMFHKDNYKIYNCPYFIKIYHYHEDEERDYTSKDAIPGPYYYPYPVTVHRKVNELIIEDNKLTKILKSNQIFWQYPVITEKRYNELNKSNENYLGIPWATMIDFNLNFGVFEEIEVKNYTTCCQHIHFKKAIPVMKKLGVNVLYTPHKIIGEDIIKGIEIRSCPLYAVNFEDPERNFDFQDKDFLEIERKYLYSFRGGWNTYYMSDIRKRIFQMEKKSDILIENSEGWHFEKTVYGGEQNKNGTYQKREDVESYNQILLNSRYSLCPSGSGPNSIRFWESLACGSIPVLLSDKLDLPLGVNWDEAILRVKEENIGNLDLILRNISLEEERKRREKCIEFYRHFKEFKVEIKEETEKYDKIVSYCCGSYEKGGFGGVARYDYQLSLVFKDRVFFKGPHEKGKMLKFLQRCKKPLIITDNHLSLDIPNKYDVLLVHHGCARRTLEKNPDWGEPWRSLCTRGQDKMLDYRDTKTTKIISTSQSCTDDFIHYYGEKYTKFERLSILHTSELDENRYKKSFNSTPVILGNWKGLKKGEKILPSLKKKLTHFEFRQLSVSCKDKKFKDFNKRKQDIYLGCDIFLQIGNSEGFSYAALDAILCGLVIVSTKVGFCYKDIPDDCFVSLEFDKVHDAIYIREKILEGWKRREELSKNCRKWYLDNCRFIDWEKKMKSILMIEKFSDKKCHIIQHGLDGTGHQLHGIFSSLILHGIKDYYFDGLEFIKKRFRFDHITNNEAVRVKEYFIESIKNFSKDFNQNPVHYSNKMHSHEIYKVPSSYCEKTLYSIDNAYYFDRIGLNEKEKNQHLENIKKFKKYFINDKLPKNRLVENNIVLHVRMGDAMKTSRKEGINNFINNLKILIDKLRKDYPEYKIYVHSDGKLDIFNQEGLVFFDKKTNILQILSDFIHSKIFICSNSGLSVICTFLGNHDKIIVPCDIKHSLPKNCITIENYLTG